MIGEAFKTAVFAEFDESLARVDAVMKSTARELSDVRDGALDQGLAALTATILGGAKYGECAECGQPYERFESPGGVHYSHFVHPVDEHDARPLGAKA